jgi:hypothetical protein
MAGVAAKLLFAEFQFSALSQCAASPVTKPSPHAGGGGCHTPSNNAVDR